MSNSMSSVMGNECSALVSVLTVVLHGVGVYSQHWCNVYRPGKHGGHPGHGHETIHEGLWRSCVRNLTFRGRFDCVDIHNQTAWLLAVQILVVVSFGGVLVSTMIKLLYHFNPSCNHKALTQGFILLGLLDGFLLLMAVSIYASRYKERHMDLTFLDEEPSHHHQTYQQLGWGFTVETVSVVLSIGSALLAMCEVSQFRREYREIGYTEIS